MLLRRAALLVPAISLAACAAMEPPPPSSPPVPPGEAPPTRFVLEGGKGHSEVDEAMLTLARSEDEIDRLFPHTGKDASRASKKKAPADEQADRKADDKAAKEETLSGGVAADPCATACRALASMTSSADHLCKLAGEGDGRCEDARGRVRGASARVRSACPACAAAK